MPIHDWTRVAAGIFHDFHHAWIEETKRALNRGLLPPDYYALAEQIATGLGPDVITLQRPANGTPEVAPPSPRSGCVELSTAPPQVQFHKTTEVDVYADKAKAVVIRHVSEHQVIAMVEIVSPGNKASRHGLRSFVDKAVDALEAGVHLLIVDLFPPGKRDPQGIHKVIWDEFADDDFVLPPGKTLTQVSYLGCPMPEAFIEPTAVGAALNKMPLFLTRDEYVSVPLEATYRSAWEAVPSYWQAILDQPATG